MLRIIDISWSDYERLNTYRNERCYRPNSYLQRRKEYLDADAVASLICRGIDPYSATNGDMIKVLFPDVDIEYRAEHGTYNVEFPNDNDVKHFSYDWWNAPYKAGREE